MAPSEALRPYADRLARLLADAHGAKVLAELQSLSAHLNDRCDRAEGSAPTPAPDLIGGVWRAERTADGVALHRSEAAGDAACHCADVSYVPPPEIGRAHV